MEKVPLNKKIAKIRRFNHFYNKQITGLDKKVVGTNFSVAESKVLNEIANREVATARELCDVLGLDTGYLSRVLQGFEKRGLIEKIDSPKDARQKLLKLTSIGVKELGSLNRLSHNKIEDVLKDLSTIEQNRLLNAMLTIETLLSEKSNANKEAFLLRMPQAGDFGWVVQANSNLHAQEYGWNEQYEAIVAQTIADYLNNLNPKKNCCWIAEKNDENVGAVFLIKKTETTAQLNLLFVEPKARGIGIGSRLVQECSRFARKAGFKKIVISTSNLVNSARKLFVREGFKVVKSENKFNFEQDLVQETWELKL